MTHIWWEIWKKISIFFKPPKYVLSLSLCLTEIRNFCPFGLLQILTFFFSMLLSIISLYFTVIFVFYLIVYYLWPSLKPSLFIFSSGDVVKRRGHHRLQLSLSVSLCLFIYFFSRRRDKYKSTNENKNKTRNLVGENVRSSTYQTILFCSF